MKRRINNLIIYIFVFTIIFASFTIPNRLLKKKELDIQMSVYNKENTENNKMLVGAEEIYLVKAIHEIESEDTMILVNSEKILETIETTNDKNNNSIYNIKEEILQLQENNIIKEFEDLNDSKFLINIVNKEYLANKVKYLTKNISLIIGNYHYQIHLEEKTGKIISIMTQKDNLTDNKEIKEILENYIKYLDLYIIDDWVYENNVMKSQKANLTVSLVESAKDGLCMLSIHSNLKIPSDLIEYQKIEN